MYVITSSDEVGEMVRIIRTRAIVDALVVDGMKNKLVVDSEQQEQMGGVVDSGGRQRRR